MNRGLRTTGRIVVTALLLSAVAVAQSGSGKTAKTSKDHPSKMSKVAFWRHHDKDKNAKPHAKPAQTKPAQAKQAQVKSTTAKQSQTSKTQVRPVSAKQTASKTTTAKAHSAQNGKSQAKSMTAQNTPASPKQ
jgi:hypothetical protein